MTEEPEGDANYLRSHLHKSLDELLTNMMRDSSLGGEVLARFTNYDSPGLGAEVRLKVIITPTLLGEPIMEHADDCPAAFPQDHSNDPDRGH